MTTYNVGPGETYEDLSSLYNVAEAGDIIDGLGASFAEQISISNDGSANEPITYRNIIISEISENQSVYLSNDDYVNCENITVNDAKIAAFYFAAGLGGDHQNLTVSNATTALWWEGRTGFSLNGGAINNATGVAVKVLASSNGEIQNLSLQNSGNFEVNASTLDLYKTQITDSAGVLLIKNGSTVALDDILVSFAKKTSSTGISIIGSTVTTAKNIRVANGGFGIGSGCVDVVLTDLELSNSLVDGISISAATGTTVRRAKIYGHGAESAPSDTGDGVTSHAGCTGQQFEFIFTHNNKNTAHAHIETSAGNIYHNTSINDGDPDLGYSRAMLYLIGTGAWNVKNSVFKHSKEYYIGRMGDPATANISLANNVYISPVAPTASPFNINGVGSTWSNWISNNGDTDSLFIHKNGDRYDVYKSATPTAKSYSLSYCPVSDTGKINNQPDNPLIGAAEVISGVNTGNVTDCNGKKLFGSAPDIGAFGVQPNESCSSLILTGLF